MATLEELKELSNLRLREADVLFQAGLYDGCVYLCGYVLESALKACICKTLAIDSYHDESFFWTHSFDKLKLLAGLQKEITLAQPALFQNWSIATEWKPESRYQPAGKYGRADAEKVLEAIRSDPNGVLQFLSRRWWMSYVATFRPDVQRVLGKLRTEYGPLVLAMLYRPSDSPEETWNFILSAPWTDRMGRAASIGVITHALSHELGFESKQLISRVTVLPTNDPFVGELTSLYQVASPGAEQFITNTSAAGIPIGVGYILYSQAQ